MKPRIHHLLDGGEQYLSWAHGRERALRATGVAYTQQRYVMDDGTLVEVRITPVDSYIRIQANGWVLLNAAMSYVFSDANAMAIVPKPNVPDPPVAPVPPVAPDPYPEFAAIYTPPTPPWVDCGPDAYGWVGGTDAYNAKIAEAQAALTPIYKAYYLRAYGTALPDGWLLDVGTASAAVGSIACSLNEFGEVRKVPGFSYDYGSAYPIAYMAYLDARDAYYASYEAALAAYTAAFVKYTADYAAWAAQYAGDALCRTAIASFYSLGRAQRAQQIAQIIADQDRGLAAQSVAMAVLRPGYVPVEEPTEPFCKFVDGTPTTQIIWSEAGKYSADPGSASLAAGATSLPSCSPSNGVSLANVYVGASVVVDGETYERFPARGGAGYGYFVTGLMAPKNTRDEAWRISTRTAKTYRDWVKSSRQPAQSALSHDLIPPHKSGTVCLAFLEYYAYDFEMDQWGWLPSLDLQTKPAAIFCDPSLNCAGVLDEYRRTNYPSRPAPNASVTKVRSRAFLKHKVGPDGELGELTTVDAEPFEIDLASYPSLQISELRDFVAVVTDVPTWAAPKEPDVRYAATRKAVSAADSASSFFKALCLQCLGRFNLK